MRKTAAALLTMVLLLSIAACARPGVEAPAGSAPAELPALPPLLTDGEELAALLDEVNAKNAALDAPTADLARYRYDFDGGEPLFTPEDASLFQALDQVEKFPETITREDAKKEIDWYFRLLRTRYGLYTFCGGDAAFAKARENLTALLDAGGETLEVEEEYAPMLRSALSFIQDNHLYLGDVQMCGDTVTVGNTTALFRRRGGDFYGGEDYGRKVVSVDGEAPETFLRRTIDAEGELCWCLYARLPEHNRLKTVTVAYQDGGEERVQLREAFAVPQNTVREGTLNAFVENGIYTVQINRMVMGGPEDGPYTEGDDEIKAEFLRTAAALRDYPVAVIDLRLNGGGNGGLPGEWFAAYTGEPLQPNYSRQQIRRQLDGGYGPPGRDGEMAAWGWTPDGDYYVQLPTPQFVDPKGPLLVVRTGGRTASAAEGFADMTRNLKNTLVVGAPTGGVLNGSMSYFNMVLPWSKLNFSYGTNLFYWDEAYFAEGRGMEPDVYLTGNDTDARLALFLERYMPLWKENSQ